MARTDWVTVCSSTLRAMAVIHSKKRRCPGRVKAEAKGRSKSCQIDQSKVACVMGHLLAVPDGMEPPGRLRLGDAPLNTIHIFRFCERIPGNYCLAPIRLMHDLGLRRGEVVTLDLADVDLVAKAVAIVGKGKSEELPVMLDKPAAAALADWI